MARFFQSFASLDGASAPQSDLAVPLLIFCVFAVLLVALFFVVLIYRHTKVTRNMIRGRREPEPAWRANERAGWLPVFDAPFRWLAIRGGNAHLIQSVLGLRNPRPCSWEEGLHRALDHKLFISPPVNGWILVMGSDLPDPGEDVDECFHFLTRLSRQLGEVQFFSMNRLFSHHAWVSLQQGKVLRGYAWNGQTVWNQGIPTEAEIALRLRTFDYFESPEKSFFAHADPVGATTEKITSLAARWSVDPTTVDFRSLRDNRGISGRFTPSPPPQA
jgi:hypothetical protein